MFGGSTMTISVGDRLPEAPPYVRGKQPIEIRLDKRIAMNGKAVFPLIMYHVFPEDFQTMADMGFHFLTPRAPDSPFLNFGRNYAGARDDYEPGAGSAVCRGGRLPSTNLRTELDSGLLAHPTDHLRDEPVDVAHRAPCQPPRDEVGVKAGGRWPLLEQALQHG